jgi:hypothetical protein
VRTLTRNCARRGTLALAVLATLCIACAAPQRLRDITRSHPGASYEAQTDGCGRRVPVARRFGGDLRAAVLWSRTVTDSARVVPCQVEIEAVQGGSREPVYRILRSTSHKEERVLTP